MCLRSCNADADMLPGQPNKFTISPVFPNPKFITFFLGKFILISPLPSCRWCTADTAPLPSPCPLCTSALPLHFLQLLLPLHISYSTSLYYPLHCSSPTALSTLSTTSSTTYYLPYLELHPACARSARARRACALRALGLLLADGAPTVGRGKTFWQVSRIFYGNSCNSGMESRKIVPRWEINRHAKG